MTARVFLCEPSGLSRGQRTLSDRWHERLFGFGFDVDQLRSESYELNPWPGLKKHVEAAHGVVVLGFRQLCVTSGTWRSGTRDEAEVVSSWTSPWLQLEAGLALAAGLPVLLAPETGVAEGIFAPETWVEPLRGVRMEDPDSGVVSGWARAVEERFATTRV